MINYIDKIAKTIENEFVIIGAIKDKQKGFYIINNLGENFIINYNDDKGLSLISLLKDKSYVFLNLTKYKSLFEMKSGLNRYLVKLDIKNNFFEQLKESNEDIVFLKFNMKKIESQKILYLDLDNVVVDFESAFSKIDKEILEKYKGRLDEIPGIFSMMLPFNNSINIIEKLNKKFNIFFLSTSPWENSSAWSDKLNWIKKYFPIIGYKRLILSHHKNLNSGDFLIDDRTANGAKYFEGNHIMFGKTGFKSWFEIYEYLNKK